LHHLDFQSLWLDELHSVIGASPESSAGQVVEYSKNDQPPLYFLLLHFWLRVFGNEDHQARLLSVLFGVATIPVMYLLGRLYRSTAFGLVLALMIAVNYHCIYFSQEARFYSLFLLLALTSYLFFLEALSKANISSFICFSIFAVLSIYTHYFGLVVAASQALILASLMVFRSNEFKKPLFWSLSFIFICLAILPWAPVFLKDLSVNEFWISPPRVWFFGSFVYQYFKDPLTVCIIFLVLTLGTVHVGRKFFQRKLKTDIFFFVTTLWAAFGLLIPLVYSIVRVSILISRYTTYVVPAIVILTIEFISLIFPVRLRVVVIGGIVLSSTIFLFLGGYYNRVQKQQFRQVAQRVAELKGTRYASISQHAWHFNYYLKKFGVEKAIHPWDDPDLSTIGSDTVFFLHIDGYDRNFEEKISKLGFEEIRRESFHAAGLKIYKRLGN
jgi:uncharacterized membrane protein